MKVGELYVHIYYYALNNIFYMKLLCMYDAMTCNTVAILWRYTVKVKIPLHISPEVAQWGAR